MSTTVQDRIALVTGGSRGIGRAVALALSRRGVHVAICGRTASSLYEAAAAIRAEGVRAWAFEADVSRNEDVERLVAQVRDAAGGCRLGSETSLLRAANPEPRGVTRVPRHSADARPPVPPAARGLQALPRKRFLETT